MVPVRVSGDGVAEAGVWFRVEAPTTAAAVRRAAERLAAQLGMPDKRGADLAIVAAEAAGNLVKHADQGVLVLRPVRAEDRAGVELVAYDSGPGMADVDRAFGDGHSTTGTLGIGLGAVARLTSWCDVHSVPRKGTVLAAQVWSGAAPPPAWVAGLARPLTGEVVSGDAFAGRMSADRRQVLVCDGLGHGPLAAAAAQAALAAFRAAPAGPPAAVVEHLHRAIRPTRGAALAVAELDGAAGTLRYAGLGNITGSVVTPGARRGLVSLPGIAGHQRRSVREYEYPLPPDGVLVMHSDGVVDRWNAADYPGLLQRSPQVIAATLLRDAGTRRDDACVVAARAGDQP